VAAAAPQWQARADTGGVLEAPLTAEPATAADGGAAGIAVTHTLQMDAWCRTGSLLGPDGVRSLMRAVLAGKTTDAAGKPLPQMFTPAQAAAYAAATGLPVPAGFNAGGPGAGLALPPAPASQWPAPEAWLTFAAGAADVAATHRNPLIETVEAATGVPVAWAPTLLRL
jgi:hypothetical protein